MKTIMENWRKFAINEDPTAGSGMPSRKIKPPSPFEPVIKKMGEPKDLSPNKDLGPFLRYANSIKPYEGRKGMFVVDLAILQGQKDKDEIVILDKKTAYAFAKFVEEYSRLSAPTWGALRLSGEAPHLDQRGSKSSRGKKSQHMFGRAIDLKCPFPSTDLENHIPWKNAVLTIAYEHGFRGFGFGPTVVHIDTRRSPIFWVYADGRTSPSYNFRRFQNLVPWGNEYFKNLVDKGMVKHLNCFLDSAGRNNRCPTKRRRRS
tara:strand:- start:11007 stop:11786 length:780 start_codon:yes stop_codon:yes gene_type:complete